MPIWCNECGKHFAVSTSGLCEECSNNRRGAVISTETRTLGTLTLTKVEHENETAIAVDCSECHSCPCEHCTRNNGFDVSLLWKEAKVSRV